VELQKIEKHVIIYKEGVINYFALRSKNMTQVLDFEEERKCGFFLNCNVITTLISMTLKSMMR
jgi:hypothetical protein